MTNSKWLSALLAGTALTVASTAAMADASFLTMTRNAAGQGVTFSVLPTADMPASATSVTISGAVSAHVESISDSTGSTEINTESDLSFAASTDTAIGKVSVSGNVNLESYTWSSYVGSLEFAPGATLSGGFATIYKADAYTAAGTTSMYSVGDDANSENHVALEFTSGPLSGGVQVFESDDMGVAAMVAGTFGDVKVKGVGIVNEDGQNLIGVQANFGIDMFSLGVAGNTGKGNPVSNDSRDSYVSDDENWYSATATAAVSPIEAWTFAASYGFEKNKDDDYGSQNKGYTLSAKWSPVAQYDVIAAYNKTTGNAVGDDEVFGVGLWFKF